MRLNVNALTKAIVLACIFCPLAWSQDKLDNDRSQLLEPMVQNNKQAAPAEKQPKATAPPAKKPQATVTFKGEGDKTEIIDSRGGEVDITEKAVVPHVSGASKAARKSAASKKAFPTKKTPAKSQTKSATPTPKATPSKRAGAKAPKASAAPTAKAESAKRPMGRNQVPQADRATVADTKLTKEKAEEIKKQDIAKLRALQKEGGAYFYTKDNKPIGPEELEKRIESGHVAGIKTVDLHLQQWKTESKPATTEQKP